MFSVFRATLSSLDKIDHLIVCHVFYGKLLLVDLLSWIVF